MRVAVVTASARSRPARTCSVEEAALSNMTCTCPPSRSVSAGAAPRYGTCVSAMPVIILNSSPHVGYRPGSGRRHVDLAGAAPRISDEFRNRARRKGRIDLHDVGRPEHAGHGRNIAQVAETESRIERRVDGVRRTIEEQRVTVRRRVHDDLGAEIAAGAAPIFDDE